MALYKVESALDKKIIGLEIVLIASVKSEDSEITEWIKKRLNVDGGPIEVEDVTVFNSPSVSEQEHDAVSIFSFVKRGKGGVK